MSEDTGNSLFWPLKEIKQSQNISICYKTIIQSSRYDKGIDSCKITVEMINEAIRRAEQRDNNQHDTWPKETGTTVYRLVRNILYTS
ncbi:MAG: hypothetical protein WBP54_12380 [Pelodictyon phaeoclathratiforme]